MCIPPIKVSKQVRKVKIYIVHFQKIWKALSISCKYFAKKARLSAGSRRLSGIANSMLMGMPQQNTNDRNCSDDNAERSTSADWRTADADDQERRRLACRCSPGMVEPFHEDTSTTSLNCTLKLNCYKDISQYLPRQK